MAVQTTITSADPDADYIAIDVQMMCELSQASIGRPFVVTLVRNETRWFRGDPRPDVIESIVCEREFDSPLPDVFSEIDDWLFSGHRLRVVESTWHVAGDTGPAAGVVLLLEGRAFPVRPLRRGSCPAAGI